MSFPEYPEYKDSGVEWLGRIPASWTVKRLGYFFNERREKVSDADFEPLSVTKQGIVPQLATAAKTDDNDNRKKVGAGDFVINSRSDRKGSSGLADRDGSVSLINTVLCPREEVLGSFVHHLLRSVPFQEEFYRYGKGIVADLWSTNYSEMKSIVLAVPSLQEQSAIAAFLDRETAKIDALVAEQETLIELLKEKRQAVISHAVTKGLDPNVPMKDSGVEWLGEVPEHWEIVRLGRRIELQRGVDITKDEQSEGSIPVVSSGGIASYHDTPLVDGPGVIVGRKGSVGSIYFVESQYWPHDTTLYVKNFYGNAPRYVFYKLHSIDLKSFDTGSSNPTLNRNLVHPVLVSWPTLVEQDAIASYLDHETAKMDALIDEALHIIDLLKERRSALISAAVTGKIEVRNYTLEVQEAV